MSEIKVEEYYRRQAKDMTNLLYDKGFLAENLAREAIDWLEDYIGFVMQSQTNMAAKCALLTKKVREREVAPYD